MTTAQDQQPETVQDHLDRRLAGQPQLIRRAYQQLLVLLHSRGLVSIDELVDQALRRSGLQPLVRSEDPNQLAGERWDDESREAVHALMREYACKHLTIEDIDEAIDLAAKSEGARDLGDVASQENVTFRVLSDHIRRFCALPLGESRLEPQEVLGIRVDLIRRLISDQLEFIRVAKQHLHIQDFNVLIPRIIGSDAGMGRIGGKAGGMFLAQKTLEWESPSTPAPCRIPDSFYLRSDVVNEFMELNGLQVYRNQKYKDVEEIRRDYPMIKGVFRNADFPIDVVQALRSMLDEIGPHPLIVRSSSLLEDRLGTAFYGKYASIFLANQGGLEFRLHSLLAAVAEVFASVYGPDPLLYRKEHKLDDYDEDMAVLIQKVVGRRIGRYFLPAFAGVAFSSNEFPFSPRIDRREGLMRLVLGLGTRAVDRVGSDYPRMVPLGQPTLRPESSPSDIRRVSQRSIDVLDLETNSLRTIGLKDLLAQNEAVPMLDGMVSIWRDGDLYQPASRLINEPPEQLCITFDKLLAQSDVTDRLRNILRSLERAYGLPVEVEFAHDGENLQLLQCRAMTRGNQRGSIPGTAQPTIPKDISSDRLVFTAGRFVRSGCLEGLEYVIYVDPRRYHEVESAERRLAIGKVVGQVNRLLADKAFALIGPGRWGSNDLLLGVRVSYVDINNAQLLIEVARKFGDFTPEVSFGTHFFQDLVEAGIQYLPLFPDDERNVFNEAFFVESRSSLPELLPQAREFDAEVRVIHVPRVAPGRRLRVIMSSEEDRAVGYLN